MTEVSGDSFHLCKDEYECLLNAINLIVERENRRNGD